MKSVVDNLFKIDNFSKLKFFNTSYREYLTIYDGYIIGIYPFAIKPKSHINCENIFLYDDGYHHTDFVNGLVYRDPCDIFEEVCGVKIHHGEVDNPLESYEYDNNIKMFDAYIKSYNRTLRINLLL